MQEIINLDDPTNRNSDKNVDKRKPANETENAVHPDLALHQAFKGKKKSASFHRGASQAEKNMVVRGNADVTRVPVGTKTNEATFAAVARRAYLYVGNVHPCATEGKVHDYLANKFPGNDFVVEPLPSRQNAQSRAFKLTSDFSLLTELYKPETWPSGILVKKFFRLRNNRQAD